MSARLMFRVAMAAAILPWPGAAPAVARAQGAARANPSAPTLVVGTLRTSDRKVAVAASEEVRSRLATDISPRQLNVVTSLAYKGTVEQSGYPYDEALSSGDLASLARALRAEEFVEGTLEKTATGYAINARLSLTRDPGLTQPLPPAEGDRIARAAAELTKGIAAARRQLDFERRCTALGRDGKAADAIAAARQGNAAYPRATLTRLCELNVRVGFKQPADSILAAALDVLSVDPANAMALGYAAAQYKAKGDQGASSAMLLRLLATDPANPRLVENAVNELAAAGQYDTAKPIISKAITENADDVPLLRLGFLVYVNSGDTKAGTRFGEEMVKIDSSLADSTYFHKMIGAYESDSAYDKAAAVAQQAVNKFPQKRVFWAALGTDLRRSGQIDQASAAYRRWLTVDPKAPARIELAKAYAAKEQFDSAFSMLREAKAADEDPQAVGAQAFAIGSQFFRTGQAAATKAGASQTAAEKAPASEKAQATRVAGDDRQAAMDQFSKVVPWMSFADSAYTATESKNSAGFFVAVASYYVASFSLVEAQAAKAAEPKGTRACDVARQSQEYAGLAQANVARGGRANPQAVGQLMGPISATMEGANRLVEAYCKKP